MAADVVTNVPATAELPIVAAIAEDNPAYAAEAPIADPAYAPIEPIEANPVAVPAAANAVVFAILLAFSIFLICSPFIFSIKSYNLSLVSLSETFNT